MTSTRSLMKYGLHLTAMLIVVSVAGSTRTSARAASFYEEALLSSTFPGHIRNNEYPRGCASPNCALGKSLTEPSSRHVPVAPEVVLYDQYNNTSGTLFESTYHTDSEAHRDYMADDFVVPPGYTWSINEVNAAGDIFGSKLPSGFNVALYTDAGTLPGTEVYTTTNATYTVGNTYYYTITIPSAILGPGSYWLMLQANGTLDSPWYWAGRDVQAFNSAAWKQPGNAYGRNCFDWTRKPVCFSDVPNDPDQLYRLVGTFVTTPTPNATSTQPPTHTPTHTVTPSPTSAATSSATATQTTIPTTTSTATVTPTLCPIEFSDVPVGHTFYSSVRCLACREIVSGYADGTFRPNNPVTRGQLAKMVSNAAGFTETITGQTFADVPPSNTFYVWIERLARRGHMSGYPCGGPGEPCINNMPYFRPFANATRGQTSKIVSNAAGFNEAVTGQTFEDVPPTHTFYAFIQRLADRGVMGGYECGRPGEPCVAPENRPYFRPNNDVTRGQSAKIVANTFFPDCETPAPR